MHRTRSSWWLSFALLSACAADARDPGSPPYERLADWGFFEGPLAEQRPAEGVLPYTVAAPLWADFAGKGRFMQVPGGETIELVEQGDWVFPLGTIFIKTFYFDTDRRTAAVELDDDAHLVETRLLVLEDEGWEPYIYLWDDAQTEAERIKGGADFDLAYTDAEGNAGTQLYLVPDQNTCEDCHARDDVNLVLGPITHQLNLSVPFDDAGSINQLDAFAALGLFDPPIPPAAELPAFAPPHGDGDLDARARAYLHGNCAHCHRPGGGGGTSGLKFSAWETEPASFGVCKVPAAAGAGAGGRPVDIWPGDPEQSIVPFRMGSVDPDIKMPELPSLLADEFGVALITEWISAMPEPACDQ